MEGHIVDKEMERVRATLKAYEELKQKQHESPEQPKLKEPKLLKVKEPRTPKTHQSMEELRIHNSEYKRCHKEQVNLVDRFRRNGCNLCGSKRGRQNENIQLTRKDGSRLYYCGQDHFQTWAREHNLVYVIDNTKLIRLGLGQFITES